MFRVKTSNDTVTLTTNQLLQMLLEQALKKRNQEHLTISESIVDYLSLTGVLTKSTLLQIITLAFSVGYYYKLFLVKNEVEVEINDSNNESAN